MIADIKMPSASNSKNVLLLTRIRNFDNPKPVYSKFNQAVTYNTSPNIYTASVFLSMFSCDMGFSELHSSDFGEYRYLLS